jgi:hypothetical protein
VECLDLFLVYVCFCSIDIINRLYLSIYFRGRIIFPIFMETKFLLHPSQRPSHGRMMENSNAFYTYTTSNIFILILFSCYISFSSNTFPQKFDIETNKYTKIISGTSCKLAIRYELGVRGSIPGRVKTFFSTSQRPDQLRGPYSLLSSCYRGGGVQR